MLNLKILERSVSTYLMETVGEHNITWNAQMADYVKNSVAFRFFFFFHCSHKMVLNKLMGSELKPGLFLCSNNLLCQYFRPKYAIFRKKITPFEEVNRKSPSKKYSADERVDIGQFMVKNLHFH